MSCDLPGPTGSWAAWDQRPALLLPPVPHLGHFRTPEQSQHWPQPFWEKTRQVEGGEGFWTEPGGELGAPMSVSSPG